MVLAAGEGRRMGGPKAWLAEPGGRPWLARSTALLRGSGADPVVVVLGAAPGAASLLAGDPALVVVATDWATGPDASLRAGLSALADADSEHAVSAAVVVLLDLPDLTPDVVRRVLSVTGRSRAALGRAVHEGRPGHPVVLGRDHWEAAPRRRRELLAGPDAVLVECGDLGDGDDLDRPEQLPAGTVRLGPHGDDDGGQPATNRG